MILNYRKLWIIIGIIGGALALAWLVITHFESVISPSDLTATRMVVTRLRIFNYIKENGTTPQSLEQLSKMDGKDNSTEDGWGRPILYSVDSNGVVTLKSFGADGRSGGDGQSKDIIQSFPTKDADGKWLGD